VNFGIFTDFPPCWNVLNGARASPNCMISLRTSIYIRQLTRVSHNELLTSDGVLPLYFTKHPSGAYDQICITFRQLRVCWCGALSLTRGRVCRLQLLLALATSDILMSESCGASDHILLSQIRDFPFRRLLRVAGLRWRYSTSPPHGIHCIIKIRYSKTTCK
jgi:hypothetical protein